MQIRYFQDGNGFIAVTDQTPKGPLHKLVYVGRGPLPGGGIESVCEQAYATDQVLKLVPAIHVPDDWLTALGYEKPKPLPVAPEPLPRQITVELELPGDRVRRMIRAPRGTADNYRVQRKWRLNAVLVVISAALAWWLVFGI